MAPSRRKAATKASAAAATRRHWKVGDLVLAKVKGFPAWPATVSEPEKWGYSSDWKKVLVYFFGTQQIAFCNPADVEAFTEEKKQSLLGKRQGKGADFLRAVQEIVESYEKLKNQIQVGVSNCADTVSLATDGNSAESPRSKELTDASEAMLDLGSKTSSNVDITDGNQQDEDTLAVGKIGSFHDNDSELQPAVDVVAKGAPVLNTYTSRKRSGGTRSQKPLVHKESAVVRRARNPSRQEPSRSLAPSLLCHDGGRSARDIPGSTSRNGSLRRSKRVRKSPDATESDEADVSLFVSNGTVEDDGSEVATVEYDDVSLNECSPIDSGSKSDYSEAPECLDGDADLIKGLDFQIKAVVVKKKRKPNRKRMANDSTEAPVKIDTEAGVEMEVQNNWEKLQDACMNSDDKYRKEDGDKHLPLVKRARVRMGGPSSAEVERSSSSRTDEKPSCEVVVSFHDQSSPLSNWQDDDDKDAEQMEGTHKHWKGMKNQLVSSVDGEAALPPTKRLHRALEAMSANAVEEGQLESEELPSIKTVFSAGCESLLNLQVAVEKEVDGLEKPSIPPMEPVKCSQSHESSDNTINGVPEKIMTELVNPAGSSNDEFESESCINKCDQNIRTSAEIQNLGKLSPDVDRDEATLGSAYGSFDKQLPRKDGCDTVNLGKLSPDVDRDEATLGSAYGSFDQQLPRKDGCDTVNTKTCNYGDNGSTEEQENAKLCPIPPHEADTLQSSLLEYAVELAASEKSEPLKSHNDDASSLDHMDEDVKDAHKERHRSGSGLTSDCISDDRNVSVPRLSPNSADRVDCFARASSSNTSMCHPSTSESAELMQSNDCCSPNVMSSNNKSLDGVVADGEPKMDPPCSERSNSIRKSYGQTEAQATLLSLENALGTLTRTKESIGRATRLAIDCAKFGVSAKVVDIIAHCLESESSLHRRVDLFFLVDSITQCSRGLKGDVGGLYPSAIQALLPRLLSAAAPRGSVAQENRRQCLKVLRVWLERRILPESILRQHIRDLDSHGASSSAGPFSRRSARTERTERSLDDPIRDMEGMLVDEYGSNSSFQLPGFCMPCMRKDEDEGSDSDGESFEAVTPEHCSEVLDKHEMTTAIEKRRHILEDVDGELEMEDVAPCEQINSSYNAGTETSKTSGVHSEHSLPLPFAPPLPQDVPPSSPPLPSSPPPFRPPLPQVLPPPPPAQPPPVTSSHFANCVDTKAYVSMHDRRDDVQQPSVAPRANSAMCGNTMPYHGSESRDVPAAVHASDCNRPSHPYPVHPVNDMQQNNGPSFHRSAYPPRPPHNAPQNHFSYGPSVQHMKSRRDCPPPYSSRFHDAPRMQSGNYYNNHERMRPDPYEFRDSWRGPPPSFSGPRYHDKGRGSYGHSSYDGHPCDRYPDHGWDYPRGSHRNYYHDRPHDNAVPVGMRGPGYWRPR